MSLIFKQNEDGSWSGYKANEDKPTAPIRAPHENAPKKPGRPRKETEESDS